MVMPHEELLVKESILRENGFRYEENIDKWVNCEKGKVFHNKWVLSTDTSNLLKQVKEALEGDENFQNLKDCLHEILRVSNTASPNIRPQLIQKYVEVDRMLHKIFGDKWL